MPSLIKTRNSANNNNNNNRISIAPYGRNFRGAIADKPRVAFVQYAMAWTTSMTTSPPHALYKSTFTFAHVLHADSDRFRSNTVGISTESSKCRCVGTPPLGMSPKTRPFPTCVTTPNLFVLCQMVWAHK